MALDKTSPLKTRRQQTRTSLRRAVPTVKPTHASGIRKGLRSQKKTPFTSAFPLQSDQPSPIHSAVVSQTTGEKRKRTQDSEAQAEHVAKPARRNPPSRLKPSEQALSRVAEAGAEADDPGPPPLSETAGEKIRSVFQEVMNSAANNASALKRTSSWCSRVPSETDTVRSQRSSNNTAQYRYKHLKAANVHIHADPPKEIQADINEIINTELPEACHASLSLTAKTFSERCREMVDSAAGEDDFVHLFYKVIEDISPNNLVSREKANWRLELKPRIQQSDVNLSFYSDEQEEVDDDSEIPSTKRHQQSAGHLYISPQHSQIPSSSSLDHTPSQPHKSKDTSPIKTARPDITTGIKESALISALVSSLSSSGVKYSNTKAKQFLEKLQDATIPNKHDGPPEPVLVIVPTQCETNLTFPTLVFEGKAYSTGRQVFEAENQAAVSGTGGVKIQMMLDELVKRATRKSNVSPPPWRNLPLLVFAICSEGPQHELWACYPVIKDGEHHFEMTLLNTCHGVLPKQVEGFLVQVKNVLEWSAGPFFESVVDGLGKVVRKTT